MNQTCDCPSTDARWCYCIRYGVDFSDEDDDGRCDCYCHDRDEPELWEDWL